MDARCRGQWTLASQAAHLLGALPVLKHWDDAVGRWLSGRVRWVVEHVSATLTTLAVLTVLLAVYSALGLGLDMDHKRMLSPDLPFQQAARDFGRYFPSLDDSLLVVIDAETPELARTSARELAARLAADEANFVDVYVPGGEDFFLRHGLLYRTTDELEEFVDQLATFQPIIADLSRDTTIANMARLIRLGLEERQRGRGDADLPALLDRVGRATVEVFSDYPVSISWESLMLSGSALDLAKRQVVIAEPVLDFDAVLPAAKPIAAIAAARQALGLLPERGVTLRLTGNPALNHEEMLGLVWDVGASGVLSFVIVTVLLGVAMRSARAAAAAAATLVIGLVFTSAFATAAVGDLNLLSVAFGVLFIGLGVDFSIHLGMQVRERTGRGESPAEAFVAATREHGSSLALCSLTTAIGFLAFVPTPYEGVAQLGVIAGAGMLVILVLTFTAFPALLVALHGETGTARDAGARELPSGPAALGRHPGLVVLVFAAATVVALFSLRSVRFDSNVIEMRNQNTESVQAFRDLLATSRTSPWSVDVLAPDLDAAVQAAARLRLLPEVEMALTLRDYVPADQEEKREILADAALMLDTPGGAQEPAQLDVKEQIAALRSLVEVLSAEDLSRRATPLGASIRQLRTQVDQFLTLVDGLDDPRLALEELQAVLLGGFPAQVERLQGALEPDEVTLASLPRELRVRLLAADGHARVQVFPRDDLAETPALNAFVDAVRLLEPDATGVAVNILEFGRATVLSLQQAITLAFVIITVLLVALLRRGADAALVLAPLVVAGVLTGGAMVVLDVPFNFANLVVLPLLLGIGVDSGIHLVRAAQDTPGGGAGLLRSTTAAAVFFSAVTTVVSFGSLAFSPHNGVASLGVVLVTGMLITLACNLVFLPALLTLRSRER
jgi:hopanoid biosynthesis associated RND transporter like protein HpnN